MSEISPVLSHKERMMISELARCSEPWPVLYSCDCRVVVSLVRAAAEAQ